MEVAADSSTAGPCFGGSRCRRHRRACPRWTTLCLVAARRVAPHSRAIAAHLPPAFQRLRRSAGNRHAHRTASSWEARRRAHVRRQAPATASIASDTADLPDRSMLFYKFRQRVQTSFAMTAATNSSSQEGPLMEADRVIRDAVAAQKIVASLALGSAPPQGLGRDRLDRAIADLDALIARQVPDLIRDFAHETYPDRVDRAYVTMADPSLRLMQQLPDRPGLPPHEVAVAPHSTVVQGAYTILIDANSVMAVLLPHPLADSRWSIVVQAPWRDIDEMARLVRELME